MPSADVQVYGSHATNLCLHWSDVDLVVKPADSEYSGHLSENYLFNVYQELRRSNHSCWISSTQFIENTTVPVIKI